MKKNQKIVIVSVAILVAIILTVTIVYALFTSKKEETAKINVGNIEVILREDWPDDVDDVGIEKNSKIVKGESIAEKKAYVRLRFIPVVEYYYEGTENGEKVAEWRTAPIAQEYINLKIEGKENWIRQGEYYYYKNILMPKESTDELKLEWELTEVPKGLTKYEKIRVDVRVLLEYSQVSNEIWKEIFQIDNLPEGVER